MQSACFERNFMSCTPQEVEKGYNLLKAKNDKRLKPHQHLLSDDEKTISDVNDWFMDTAGSLTDKYFLVKEFKGRGNLLLVPSQSNKMEIKMLALFIINSHQEKPVNPTTTQKMYVTFLYSTICIEFFAKLLGTSTILVYGTSTICSSLLM